MRLDADHHQRRRVSPALALALVVAAAAGAACSRTWVLGSNPGAGGAGDAPAGGAGGMPAPGGSGGFPGFGGHVDNGTGGHGSGMCSTRIISFNIPPTDVVFVVGRNNSMMTKFGDYSRMTSVQMTVHSVISANENSVQFGYEAYPSFTGCGSSGTTCCPSSEQSVRSMSFASMSFADIDNALYAPCDPSGSGAGSGCVAPTDSRAISQSLALSAIGDLFSTAPDPASPRYAVLITDGAPGCPTEDPMIACTAAESAVSTLAKNAGIKTFVIGLGDSTDGDMCLEQLATMGGTGMPPYVTTDFNSLTKALTQVVNVAAVTPCTLILNATPEDRSLVALVIQNKEVPYDSLGGNGWNYISPTRIQLHGTACQYVQNFHSQPSILFLYGCPPCTASNPTPNCLL